MFYIKLYLYIIVLNIYNIKIYGNLSELLSLGLLQDKLKKSDEKRKKTKKQMWVKKYVKGRKNAQFDVKTKPKSAKDAS